MNDYLFSSLAICYEKSILLHIYIYIEYSIYMIENNHVIFMTMLYLYFNSFFVFLLQILVIHKYWFFTFHSVMSSSMTYQYLIVLKLCYVWHQHAGNFMLISEMKIIFCIALLVLYFLMQKVVSKIKIIFWFYQQVIRTLSTGHLNGVIFMFP